MQVAESFEVWLLTAGAQVSRGLPNASQVGAWGMARSARAEAALPVACVDVPVFILLLQGRSMEPEVVLLLQTTHVPRLATAPPITVDDAVRDANSHLVTGGTGGLGLLTACWLSERGAYSCLLYTSPSPRDQRGSRMPSSA